MTRRFKAIIFDCDGVLVDSEIIANRVEVEVKNEFGLKITLEEQLSTFIGLAKNDPRVIEELKRLPKSYWKDVEIRCRAAYTKELRTIDGVAEVLDQLKLPMCVASNSESDSLEWKLKHTKIDDYFKNAAFSRTMVKQGKPSPDLYLYALKKMGWKAESTLVIEDSVAGVTAGKAAGMEVWGFIGGKHIRPGHEARLVSAGADRIISDIRSLLSLT